MMLRQLFDPETSTYTYLVVDEATRRAALIDPVLEQHERDLTLIRELDVDLVYVLDTHVHADHVTGSGRIAEATGARIGLAAAAGVEHAELQLEDGQTLPLGSLEIHVISTPGHTDGCLTYLVDGSLFTGDALLIRGTGRTDFQQGSSPRLWDSITRKLFSLPDDTLVFPGHDYKGRTCSTIGEEKAHNPRVGAGKTRTEFLQLMADLKLAPPRKIKEAVPRNLLLGLSESELRARARHLALQGLGAEAGPNGVFEIDPSRVVGWLTAKPAGGARLVDVRARSELVQLPALPGAEVVPLETLAAAAAPWDRAQPIVVICRSGVRSLQAARTLASLGFERVMSMRGGMLAASYLLERHANPLRSS